MIEKIGLRDQVKSILQKRMFSGMLKIGQRISIPDLAKELGVSVTPVREALTQLIGMEIVEYIFNRGFFIPELKMEVAIDIYPLISSLECFLLSSSPITEELILKLKIQQKMFVDAESPEDIVMADMKFHEALLSNSDNAVAKTILTDLKTRIYFYEVSYMQQLEINQNSTLGHEHIIKCLTNNNLDGASKALAKNWSEGFYNSRKYFENK